MTCNILTFIKRGYNLRKSIVFPHFTLFLMIFRQKGTTAFVLDLSRPFQCGVCHFCTLSSSKDPKTLFGWTAVFLVVSLLSFSHSRLFIAAFAVVVVCSSTREHEASAAAAATAFFGLLTCNCPLPESADGRMSSAACSGKILCRYGGHSRRLKCALPLKLRFVGTAASVPTLTRRGRGCTALVHTQSTNRASWSLPLVQQGFTVCWY